MTDIEAIRARLAAATPGPWRFLYDASHTIVADSPGEEGRSVGAFTGGPAYVVGGTYNYPEPQNAANAEFIAHAPEDIATLIDVIFNLRNQWASALDEADEEIELLQAQRDAAIQKLQMYLFAISEGAFTMTEDWLVSDFKGLLHILGAPE